MYIPETHHTHGVQTVNISRTLYWNGSVKHHHNNNLAFRYRGPSIHIFFVSQLELLAVQLRWPNSQQTREVDPWQCWGTVDNRRIRWTNSPPNIGTNSPASQFHCHTVHSLQATDMTEGCKATPKRLGIPVQTRLHGDKRWRERITF